MKKAKKAQASKPTKAVPAFYQYRRGPSSDSRGFTSQAMDPSAQRSNTIAELRRFLKKHEPADGEYQDGLHRSRVRAAQYELMRLEYISGNIKGADELLALLQDLT